MTLVSNYWLQDTMIKTKKNGHIDHIGNTEANNRNVKENENRDNILCIYGNETKTRIAPQKKGYP